jgi:hypothetical protein
MTGSDPAPRRQRIRVAGRRHTAGTSTSGTMHREHPENWVSNADPRPEPGSTAWCGSDDLPTGDRNSSFHVRCTCGPRYQTLDQTSRLVSVSFLTTNDPRASDHHRVAASRMTLDERAIPAACVKRHHHRWVRCADQCYGPRHTTGASIIRPDVWVSPLWW